jgi:hypothetical protein
MSSFVVGVEGSKRVNPEPIIKHYGQQGDYTSCGEALGLEGCTSFPSTISTNPCQDLFLLKYTATFLMLRTL